MPDNGLFLIEDVCYFMSDNTVLFIFVIVTSLLCSIAVLLISAKIIKLILLRKLPENTDSFYANLRHAQEVIESSKRRLVDDMVSYGKYKELLQTEANMLERMDFLKVEAKQMSQDIKALNKDIVEKERKKDELKKNSTDTLLLIGELMASKTTLEDEMVVLQGSLDTSKVELQTLVDEIEMAEEQRKAFQELSDTLDEVKDRLFEVSSTYKDSSKNLMELENQYQSLEKEYKKLIELNIKKEAAAAEG